MLRLLTSLAAVAVTLRPVACLELNATDPQSVRDVAQNLTLGVLSYYRNYNTSDGIQDWQVGLFPFLPYVSGRPYTFFVEYERC